MTGRTLEHIRWVRLSLLAIRHKLLRTFRGIEVGNRTIISLSCRIASRRRGMVRIGEDSLLAFKTMITTINEASADERAVTIGSRCFIGGGAVVGPGVVIGDDSIVGAGSVVLESIPAGSVVAGNPARVIKSGIIVQRSRDKFHFRSAADQSGVVEKF